MTEDTIEQARAAMKEAREAVTAHAERLPNARDFDGPTHWAKYDAAMLVWAAERDRLVGEVIVAREAFRQAWGAEA